MTLLPLPVFDVEVELASGRNSSALSTIGCCRCSGGWDVAASERTARRSSSQSFSTSLRANACSACAWAGSEPSTASGASCR